MDDSSPTYRPSSSWAVISTVAAVVSGVAYLELLFLPCAVMGIVAGAYSRRQIHRYGHLGKWCASFGLAMSLFVIGTAPLWHLWMYQIEAPAGYVRLDFGKLTKSEEPELNSYLGRNVFLKGYVYPQSDSVVKRFVLMATGDPNKRNAMMIVNLVEASDVWYDSGILAVSGVLERNPLAEGDAKQPKYLLKKTSLRRNRTGYDLSPRTHGMGC